MGSAPKGLTWDHRNRDKLDNRRENFRLVTMTVNQRNRSRNSRLTKSGIVGVHLVDRRWWARIVVAGEDINLGRFDTIEEAAIARKKGEEKYWGANR